MTDRDKEANLTSSQMIRRAVRRLRTKTLEEKERVMRASERLDEEIKARFVNHWRFKTPPKPES